MAFKWSLIRKTQSRKAGLLDSNISASSSTHHTCTENQLHITLSFRHNAYPIKSHHHRKTDLTERPRTHKVKARSSTCTPINKNKTSPRRRAHSPKAIQPEPLKTSSLLNFLHINHLPLTKKTLHPSSRKTRHANRSLSAGDGNRADGNTYAVDADVGPDGFVAVPACDACPVAGGDGGGEG